MPSRMSRLALVLSLFAVAACSNSVGGRVAAPLNADDARRIFTQQGYAGLQNLRPESGGFAAEATRDGVPVTVVIDGNGIIHTR